VEAAHPAPGLFYTLIFVGASLLLVLLNGFFVAAEFAVVKVRRTRLKELEGKGIKQARISILCVDDLDETLSATQLGITLVSLALGWIGEESFYNVLVLLFPRMAVDYATHFHTVALTLSFFTITLLHVVIGELVPKGMAIQRAEQITLIIARPLRWFYRAARPLIRAFTGLANIILRLLGFHGSEDNPLSEEELKMVLKDSHDEGVISDSEAQIINRAFEFSDKVTGDIMLPADQVKCLDMEIPLEENIEITRQHMHTRFPLVRGGFQNMIGVVHMKEALIKLRDSEDNSVFLNSTRPVLYVSPGMRQDKLMKILNERRSHLAVVQDPNTKENLGIVTLKDILEHLVGKIRDEHGN
jgi:CBS domain containing-hemolysin-like protein